MDLTAQVINEVEFSMARRGYDPDQVDVFLEKVAAKVEEATQREAALRERLAAAERRLAEGDQRGDVAAPAERVVEVGPSEAELSAAAEAELETLKRTLLLAQRTADAAVREAEADARRILAEAETGARAAHEATRTAVMQEITDLEALRDSLKVDVESLETAIGSQRVRLQVTVADLVRLLEEPSRLGAAAPPVLSAPISDQVAEAPIDLDADADDAPAHAAGFAEEDVDDDAWARFSAPDDDLDLGPRTEPVLRLDKIEDEAAEAAADDAYLTELRKAMLDDTGAPNASDIGLFDRPDETPARTARFGRKR